LKWHQVGLALEESVKNKNGFVYPNPSNGSFQFKFENQQEEIRVNIYDYSGQLLSTEVGQSFNNYEVSIQVKPGIYIIKYEMDGMFIIERISVY
jgi:hypothetical protein